MQIVFVCALYIEAEPLLKKYSLIKVEEIANFQVFSDSNQEVYLIISGVGKIKSAIATALILQSMNKKLVHIINFGICGSCNLSIGKIFLVNQILDNSTQKTYYPDILINTNLLQEKLLSVSLPIVNQEIQIDGLIDMEGSGFFDAASTFLKVHQIHLIKIVSDNLNQKKLDKNLIAEILEEKIEIVFNFIDSLKSYNSPREQFSNLNQNILENFLKQIHLTKTEQHEFYNFITDICVQEEISVEFFLKKTNTILNVSDNKFEKGKKVRNFVEEYRKNLFI